jgi:hypothetical protein
VRLHNLADGYQCFGRTHRLYFHGRILNREGEGRHRKRQERTYVNTDSTIATGNKWPLECRNFCGGKEATITPQDEAQRVLDSKYLRKAAP